MYTKSNSRIIIIGASGLIGATLFNHLKENNYKVIGTFCKNPIPGLLKFDMSKQKISDVISNINKRDIFILLSAFSNPNWIFENKEIAYEINVNSTINLIKEISDNKSKFFFMSSVEVFDGKQGSYTENSKPNPLNYYGKTKLTVEDYLIKNCSNFTILRTGWNVGIDIKSRCVVTLTYETLLKQEAKMAIDNSFCITSVKDLAKAISEILMLDDLKVCHLSSFEEIKRTDLAKQIIKSSKRGKEMKFNEVSFNHFSSN